MADAAAERIVNVVVAVCHPDDEVIWIGGLLRQLAQLRACRVFVVCLSGVGSERQREFDAVGAQLGYDKGVIVGGPLGPATTPIADLVGAFDDGIAQVGLDATAIDLLLTHGATGDEHLHPHHRQAHRELYGWARRHGVPFGSFACFPHPQVHLAPLLRAPKMRGGLRLCQVARCVPTLEARLLSAAGRGPFATLPRYYVQVDSDREAKQALLDGYASIDPDKHRRSYWMANSAVEGLYLFDERAFSVVERVLGCLDVLDVDDMFPSPLSWKAIAARLRSFGRTRR